MARVNTLGTAVLGAALVAALSACGGGSPVATPPAIDPASVEAQPAYHRAPMALDTPGTLDADGLQGSAGLPPQETAIPQELAGLDTAQLTDEAVEAYRRARPAALTPQASSTQTLVTYTPAQIRAAYGLPVLPPRGAQLSEAQAAELGSGQTIYIIDSFTYPSIAQDLAVFDATFGLPVCTTVAIPVNAKLPLAPAAAGSACTLSIVYATASGAMTTTAPAYNASWAGETALDVQWAHATAPLARIILLEVPDASMGSINNVISLANRMGPGVVSMSFGAPEWSGETAWDVIFRTPGMSYFAATGDAGAGVEWPSAAPTVMAVGGTTLTYKGGARSEVAWSKTGGGISSYEPEPSYQSAVRVPGESAGNGARRGVADVAFNADVNTGQYVVMSLPSVSKGATLYYDFGGTSLSTPQWAGIAAVANAIRATGAVKPLGDFHASLYARMGSLPGIYATSFTDITRGADGSCASCSAGAGYDLPTGFGTPNVQNLLGQMVAF